MSQRYIYEKTEEISRKYRTRNPFELLDAIGVITKESDAFQSLKGFCLTANRSTYVVINGLLHPAEKRIVAAHELGHILLHRNLLKMAPMKDTVLYDMASRTEYEANLFAADLLIEDNCLEELRENEDMDYFQMCSRMQTSPDLMSFKLFSMMKRGQDCPASPLDLNSRFLGKK